MYLHVALAMCKANIEVKILAADKISHYRARIWLLTERIASLTFSLFYFCTATEEGGGDSFSNYVIQLSYALTGLVMAIRPPPVAFYDMAGNSGRV